MRQLIRFGLVGVFNTFFGYAIIFSAMYGLQFSPVAANALGYGLGLITSYWLNRTFTFRSTSAVKPEVVKFLVVVGLSYAVNLIVLLVWMKVFGLHEGLGQLAAGVAYIASSYALNKYFVFQRSKQAS
ncbi:GtrA family protein [Variovorax sp. J22P271]|uniref:GtrA family protein n=1 Tax=Variovorax davisae TaxID=3053515 RepID=UPI002576293D|nr:GtrA family protein [Variovorax sp. J22P271]MDM0033308.1 GtrA family protein [Variovorax sp. J22P271]